MRVNNSLLQSFKDCDLKGHWLRSMPRAKASARTLTPGNRYGQAQHKVLEDVYTRVKQQLHVGPLHSPDTLSFAKRSVHSRCEELEVEEDAKLQLWEAVLDYLMEQHYVVGDDILGIEKFLRAKTPGGNEITGFADRIDRMQGGPPGVSIVDYKGGSGRPDPESLRNHVQGQFYVTCAMAMYPWAQRFEFRLEMLGSRYTARVRWSRLEASYMATAALKMADERAREISTSPWLPNTGSHCDWCPFRGRECPATGGDVPDGWYDPRLSWDEQTATM